jgi:hypothetical protein
MDDACLHVLDGYDMILVGKVDFGCIDMYG